MAISLGMLVELFESYIWGGGGAGGKDEKNIGGGG